MALKNLGPMHAVGSDIVHTSVVFKPNGVGVPVLSWGPAVSGVVRTDVGKHTVTLKDAVYGVVGGGFCNKPSGAAQYFIRIDHTVSSADVVVYITTEAGVLTDIDLTGGGDITLMLDCKQNPGAVK